MDDFDRLGSEMPLPREPAAQRRTLMEDFCYAGGLPVVMKEIAKARCT